ncbi:LysR substrate-binding domain-containing protein [Nitratidesulfovibrio sp.]|uniref:LysR family transcriptional regulator n=1 Tax=Nitratidesulfovibrio sp. TaxID=2802297 RepID=UPI00333E472D
MATDLDMELLRVFVALVDAGGFSRAGERLFLSQPAVSGRLRRLEARCGVRLVERAQGRMAGLTEAGAQLLEPAREILRLNDAALRGLAPWAGRGASTPQGGTVRLGFPDDVIVGDLPELFRRLGAAHSEIRLELRGGLSRDLREAVASGALDAALVQQAAGAGGLVLRREPLGWLTPPGGVAADSDGVLPLVLFPEGCAYRDLAVAALASAGRPWRVAVVSATLPALTAAVLGGAGVAPLPASAVASALSDHPSLAPCPSPPLLPSLPPLPPLPDVELVLLSGSSSVPGGATPPPAVLAQLARLLRATLSGDGG